MKRVAIDLRPLQIGHQNRGIGAYLLNLLERLPDDPSVTYLFVRYSTSNPLEDFKIQINAKHKDVVLQRHTFNKRPDKLFLFAYANLFSHYGPLRRHRPQVFFQADYLLGAPRFPGCKIVTVSHDLIPYKFRQIYLPHWTKYLGFHQFKLKSRLRLILRAWYYEMKYAQGVKLLKRSSAIISVSDSTKSDLLNLLGFKDRGIKVIHSAASFREGNEEDIIRPEIKKQVEGLRAPYVCYVGGTDRRRQVDELVYAFNLYNARIAPLSLVLCGNEFEENSKEINPLVKSAIEDSSYKSNILSLGRISEAEKKFVLTHASAFVYPTLYEGFGLPLLEALACGTRIISYKNSSIPEIAGDLPIYTEATGGYAIFETLVKHIATPVDAKYRDKAMKRAKTFDWDVAARRTWDTVLQKVSE